VDEFMATLVIELESLVRPGAGLSAHRYWRKMRRLARSHLMA
jgi:hypothetical protein